MPEPPATPRPASEIWTVGRILEWTTQHLKTHGSESPRLDAQVLLAHTRGCPRIKLYTDFNEVLSDNERAVMRELVKRRAAAEPVAYLVGHREFFSLDFRVTRDVLIPRPETETLVLEVVELAKSLAAPKILDIGTGSGCIAISLATQLPLAHVTAVDISEPALRIAQENAGRLRVTDRVRFLLGDLLAPVPSGETFDFIVSNPPYVTTAELETLPADIRHHEPRSALDGGPDGFAVLSRLVIEAPPFLNPGGWLLLEISPEQAEPMRDVFTRQGAFVNVAVAKDLAGKARVVMGQLKTPV
jgi:release factor glutamine methyltransferase